MSEYRLFAEYMVEQANAIICAKYQHGMNKEWKTDNTPVTETDLAINRLLIEEVTRRFPNHGVLGEEESGGNPDAEYVWVCDPLDGTIPFSHGMSFFTFSLALVQNGKPILGIIVDPLGKRVFFAEEGKGATMNGVPIRVGDKKTLQSALGNIETYKAPFDLYALKRHLGVEEGAKIITLASVIYSSVLVALGEVAFVVFPARTAHDMAAVKIIVEEAGGKVTDLFGDEQRYDRPTQGALVSNGYLHETLLTLIHTHVPKVPSWEK